MKINFFIKWLIFWIILEKKNDLSKSKNSEDIYYPFMKVDWIGIFCVWIFNSQEQLVKNLHFVDLILLTGPGIVNSQTYIIERKYMSVCCTYYFLN